MINRNRILFSAGLIVFGGFVVWAFMPGLKTFFDPEDFVKFLNPMRNSVPFFQQLKFNWVWLDNQDLLRGFFRPVSSILYMLEYSVFRFNPTPYRIVTLLVHLICGWLVGRTVYLLGGRKWVAAGSSLLFILHPGTAKAVCWIVARPDIIATLFALLAFQAVLKLRTRENFSWTAVLPAIFIAFAVGGKELGIACFFALPILYFLWPERTAEKKNTILFCSSVFVVLVFYFISRFLIFGNLGGYTTRPAMVNSLGWIPTVVLQATGSANLDSPLTYIPILGSVAVITVFIIRKGRRSIRELLPAILITGIFSFQSLMTFPEPHYVYPSAAFTTVFLGYFFSVAITPFKFRKIYLLPVFFAVLAISGLTLRKEASSLTTFEQHETIFRGLEGVSSVFQSIDPDTCYVVRSASSPEGMEMKNVPIYMAYIQPSDCEFLNVNRIPHNAEFPVLLWNGSEVKLISF